MTAPTRSRARPSTPIKDAPPPRKRAQHSKSVTASRTQPGQSFGERVGSRSSAAERAYARRAQRADQLQQRGNVGAQRAGAGVRLRLPRSRASFVVIVMGLLAAGVAVTLWLSTQAIAGTYQLEHVRQDNAALAEQAEQLQQDVTQQESAPAVALRARAMGMVPGGDPARIVVNPDGSTRVVGEPQQAQGSAPAAPPAQAEPNPPAPPAPNSEQTPPVPQDGPAAGEPGTADTPEEPNDSPQRQAAGHASQRPPSEHVVAAGGQ